MSLPQRGGDMECASGRPERRRRANLLIILGALVGSAALSGLLALVVGSGCGPAPFDPVGTSDNQLLVGGLEPELDLSITGRVEQVGTQKRLVRSLYITPRTEPGAYEVTIKWYPPDTAYGHQSAPFSPAYPGQYPFTFVYVFPRGPNEPTLTMSYYDPYTAYEGAVLVDTVIVISNTLRKYKRSYRYQVPAMTGGADVTTSVGTTLPPARGSDVAGAIRGKKAAADYKWYGTEMWFYDSKAALDGSACQQWIDLLQSPGFFLAVRFPIPPDSPDPNDATLPLVELPEGDSAPRLSLLDESKWPATTVLSLALEVRPEWMGYAENNLPAKEGERWLAMAPATEPRIVCPSSLSLAAGKWEFYARAATDYGGGEGCPNCQLEIHACWSGQSAPFFFPGSVGGLLWRGLAAGSQAEGVTCTAAWPTRLFSRSLDPPYRVSGPGYGTVDPPQHVQLHHTVSSRSTSAIALTLSVASSSGLPWQLYQGTADQPSLSQPISAPVSLPGSGMIHFWVVGDVPGSAHGSETVTVTASSTSPQGSAWNTDTLWLGEWTPPPTPAPTPTPTPAEWRAVIPAVAHAPGVPPSQWRTSTAVVNRGAGGAELNLTFLPYQSGGTTLTRTASLAAGATVEWHDLLVELFEFSSSATAQGSVAISSDQPLAVTSRTFNQTAAGTYGQFVPAVAATDAIAAGHDGVLAQLKRSAAFRTNVGLLALESGSATLRAWDAGGVAVGSPVSKTLEAGRYWQASDFFGPNYANAGDRSLAYVTVDVTSGSMWAYGSVVDNATGDPTTIPVLAADQAGPYLIAAVAHAPGVPPTQWRTSTAIVNRSPETADLTLTYLPYQSGGTTVTRSATLGSGATVEWSDLLVDLFGFDPSATVQGSVLIDSTVPVVLTSRTFNQTATGTYGQFVPAIGAGQALVAGEAGVLAQLQRSAAFRTNVGLLALEDATVLLTAHGADGATIGTPVRKSLGANRYWQAFDFLGPGQANAGDQAIAYVVVEVESGAVWAYASVVDNVTGDPTTIPVQAE